MPLFGKEGLGEIFNYAALRMHCLGISSAGIFHNVCETIENQSGRCYDRTMTRLLLVLTLLCFSPLCASCAQTVGQKPQPVEDVFLPGGDRVKVAVWIEDLKIPWSLLFLPDGRAW